MKISGRKLTFPIKYEHFALVLCKTNFPMDALRYDSAHPWRERDARLIEDSLRDFGPKDYSVIIRRYWDNATPVWGSLWHSFSNIKFEPISAEEASAIKRDDENKLPERVESQLAVVTQRTERLGNAIFALEANFHFLLGRLKGVLTPEQITEVGYENILRNIENLKDIKKNWFD